MTDTVKIAIARLVSSTAPVGTVSGTVGPYEVAVTADGSVPGINTLPSGAAIYGGRYLASQAMISETTLISDGEQSWYVIDNVIYTAPDAPSTPVINADWSVSYGGSALMLTETTTGESVFITEPSPVSEATIQAAAGDGTYEVRSMDEYPVGIVIDSSADVPSPDADPTPAPEPTGNAIAQTAEFGEETGAGEDSYGFQLLDSGGTPLSGVTVTGGTATGVAVSSDGILRPATDGAFAGQDGATVEHSSTAGTGVCTLRVVPGESVGTMGGFHNAMQRSFAEDGGKIIRVMSMLNSAASRTFEPANKAAYPTNPTRIIGKGMGTGFTHGLVLRHASNVKMEALEFACPDPSVGRGVCELAGYVEQPEFIDCYIHGNPKDPLGDYSAGFSDQIHGGITNVASGRGSLNGLTLTRCKIYDVNRSLEVKFGGARTEDSRPTLGYYRTDNIFVNAYSDGPGQSFLGTAKDMEIVIDGDVSYAHLGSPTDEGNPHIDNMFQVISASNDADDRITNLTLRNTVTFETSLSNGRGSHGTLTSFGDSLRDGPERRVIFVNPVIENNISIVSGNHHFTFRCEGGTLRNNTLASPVGIPNPNPGHAHCYIKLQANNDDPITIENNIAARDETVGGPGSPTINRTGNVNLGLNGSSQAGGYADVFEGVGSDYYSAENWSDIIAAFTPKAGSSVDGAGAIGADGSFGRADWHPGPMV